MRATSTMREGEDRPHGRKEKLLPKAPPRGDSNEVSNMGQFPGRSPARRTCCWTKKGRVSSTTSG